MPASTTLLALTLAPLFLQDTSQVFGLDTTTQQVVRSETGAFLAGLAVVGPTGAAVEAVDFDANGRHLWAAARDGATVRIGSLDVDSGAFTARGSAPIAGEVTDMAASPDGRTWLLAEDAGVDAVVWRGDVSGMSWQPWVTLPGTGALAGLAIDAGGRVLACESATGRIVELDPNTGAPSVLATLQGGGDLPRGMDHDWANGALFSVLGPGAPRLVVIDPSTGATTLVADLAGTSLAPHIALRRSAQRLETVAYCSPAQPNSTGLPGRLAAFGSPLLEQNDLRLSAGSMPTQSFGLFLTSFEVGAPVAPAGAVGTLCLSGSIGRLGLGGQLLPTGAEGSFSSAVDLRVFPQPTGPVWLEEWQSLYFQAWFRDVVGGVSTSNFTAALRVDATAHYEGSLYADTGVRLQTQPRPVHFQDVDGDALPDLLQSGVVRHNRGDLTFGDPEGTVISTNSARQAVADFDGDGDLDVAASAGFEVVLHWNEGAAGTTVAPGVQTCGSGTEIRAADFDGDGRVDFAVQCESGVRLLVAFNEGSRTFSAPVAVPLVTNPRHLCVADLDGDGLPDFLVGSVNSTVQVVESLGARTFAAPTVVAVDGAPTSVAVADLDGDGDTDAVTVAGSSGRISLLHNGAGQFGPYQTAQAVAPAFDVAVGDVDGDGIVDLAVVGSTEAAVQVLRGLGGSSYAPPTLHPAGESPLEIQLVDLDLDGDADAFVQNGDRYYSSVLAGGPDGYQSYPDSYPTTHFTSALLNNSESPFLGADFDQDGDVDLLVLSTVVPQFELYRNNGDGTFAQREVLSVPASADHARVADVDDDGLLDVVLVSSGASGRQVLALLGDGSGGFAPGPPRGFFANDPDDLVVADVDGDGHLDVAFPDFGQIIFHGDGTGAFGPQVRVVDDTLPIPSRWLSLDYGDLDGDGHMDAVGGRRSDDALLVQFGDGSGGFEGLVRIGDAEQAVFAVDVDDDGRLDVVGANGAHQWRTYLNGGNRTFAQRGPARSVPASFRDMVDVDGDGLLDIVGSSDGYGPVGVSRGLGFGEFDVPSYFGTGELPGAIVVEDLDGDGDRDLALLDDRAQRFTVYFNRAQ